MEGMYGQQFVLACLKFPCAPNLVKQSMDEVACIFSVIRDNKRMQTFTGLKRCFVLFIVKFQLFLLDQLNIYQTWPKHWCLSHRLLDADLKKVI